MLLICFSISARAKYADYARKGGKSVKTSSTTTYKLMETFPSSTITVYKTGTLTLANLYTDNAGTVKANPFTADSVAYFEFYADNGRYDIKFSGTGITSPFTRADIILSDIEDPYDPRNFGAVCDGITNATTGMSATISAIVATGYHGTLTLPTGAPCRFNSLTQPAGVTFDYASKGGSIFINSGQTFTEVGPKLATPRKIYYNSVSGQGTISYSGNSTIIRTIPEWWGAIGDGSTNNSSFLQASSDALVTNGAYGSGTIELGNGTYLIGTTWIIGKTSGGGDGLGQFTGVSLQGSNGLVGTVLKWIGSTSGQMIKITRGRYQRISDIQFDSAVVKGTTIGLWLDGPNAASGEQTSGSIISLCEFRNFNVGVQLGGGGVGSTNAAGEATFINSTFSSNNYGYRGTSTGNTLVIRFINCSAAANLIAGLMLDSGSGDTHIEGGGFGANGTLGVANSGDIGLSLGWNGTVHIQDLRLEQQVHGGIFNIGGMGEVTIDHCAWANAVAPIYPIIRVGNAGRWTIKNNSIGGDDQDSWWLTDLGTASGLELTIENNRIQNHATMTAPTTATQFMIYGITVDPDNTGPYGTKVHGRGNYYTTVGAITKIDDIEGKFGLIVSTNKTGLAVDRRVNTDGIISADQLLFPNQDTTPSVKFGSLFKTQNSAGTIITNFDDGIEGQTFQIFINDANTTIKNNSTIVTRSGADIAATNGFTYSFTLLSSKWRQN